MKAKQIERGEDGYQAIEDGIATIYQAIEVILGWAVGLVPLAVFGVVARTVGLYGFGSFRGVLVYVAVGVLGLAIQVLVVYQAWLILVAQDAAPPVLVGGEGGDRHGDRDRQQPGDAARHPPVARRRWASRRGPPGWRPASGRT